VQVPGAEREKWRTKRIRMLRKKLQNTPRQIDELKSRNRDLEENLQLAGTGKRDAVSERKDAMTNAVFWDVALCSYCVNRRFGGTYHLHLQGRKIRERGTSVSR
jgi:hypothetical protein